MTRGKRASAKTTGSFMVSNRYLSGLRMCVQSLYDYHSIELNPSFALLHGTEEEIVLGNNRRSTFSRTPLKHINRNIATAKELKRVQEMIAREKRVFLNRR